MKINQCLVSQIIYVFKILTSCLRDSPFYEAATEAPVADFSILTLNNYYYYYYFDVYLLPILWNKYTLIIVVYGFYRMNEMNEEFID